MTDANESSATPLPRITLIDGDSTTPLSAEALVVALFALLPSGPQGQVITLALAAQAQLDAGQRIAVQVNRVLRPDGPVRP